MVNFIALATVLLPVFASLTLALPSNNWEGKHKTHHVVVGGPGKIFYSPSNIHANVGDTIRFTFKQKNHTVTQSSFEYPCQAIDHGFDSGFKPVPDDQKKDFPTYEIVVKDKKPIWAYCQQTAHCSQGMVFAANAPRKGKTFSKFKKAAIATADRYEYGRRSDEDASEDVSD